MRRREPLVSGIPVSEGIWRGLLPFSGLAAGNTAKPVFITPGQV